MHFRIIVLLSLMIGLCIPPSARAFLNDFPRMEEMFNKLNKNSTVIETTVETHANTGGNSVSGSDGVDGGIITSGSAVADVHVETNAGKDSSIKTIIDVSVSNDTENVSKVLEVTGSATTSVHIETRQDGNEVGKKNKRIFEENNDANYTETNGATSSINADTHTYQETVSEQPKRRKPRLRIIQAVTSLFSYVFSFFNR